MKPILEIYPNPALAGREIIGDCFTHFEIQSVREYETPDGTRFFEPCQDESDMMDEHPGGQATGPAMLGVYGRLNKGVVEHLADFSNLKDARELLSRIGCNI